eukprot:14397009-Alexandrium_andersonii.AAC.1
MEKGRSPAVAVGGAGRFNQRLQPRCESRMALPTVFSTVMVGVLQRPSMRSACPRLARAHTPHGCQRSPTPQGNPRTLRKTSSKA